MAAIEPVRVDSRQVGVGCRSDRSASVWRAAIGLAPGGGIGRADDGGDRRSMFAPPGVTRLRFAGENSGGGAKWRALTPTTSTCSTASRLIGTRSGPA